ncbi:MAG: hypothetical protein R3D30_09810 [Hyphomicrobiales bacterium]
MLDNLTVTGSGLVVLQEDPGSSSRTAKIWLYDPSADHDNVGGTSGLKLIAEHDPDRFDNPGALVPGAGVASARARNPRASSTRQTALFGANHLTFLLDSMVSYADPDGEIVGGGQLMALTACGARPTTNSGATTADVYDGGFGNDRLKGADGKSTSCSAITETTADRRWRQRQALWRPGRGPARRRQRRDKLYGALATISSGGAGQACGDVAMTRSRAAAVTIPPHGRLRQRC